MTDCPNFTVRVRVKSASAHPQTLLLPLSLADTVATMMQAVEKHTNMAARSQKLIHNGILLEPHQVISELVSTTSSTPPSFLVLQTTDMDACVRLTARTANNRKLEFDMKLGCTIKNVKQLVEFTYGLKALDSTVVFYNNLVLQDEKTLFDYGITSATTLYILPQIRDMGQNHPLQLASARISVYQKMVSSLEAGQAVTNYFTTTITSKACPQPSTSAVPTETPTLDPAPPQRPPSTKLAVDTGPVKRRRSSSSGFGGLRKGFFDAQKKPKITEPEAAAPELERNNELTSGGAEGTTAIKVAYTSKGKPKCWMPNCKEKLKLTAITCRCGHTFCTKHRHAEAHGCPVDYKMIARTTLEKSLIPAQAQRVAAL